MKDLKEFLKRNDRLYILARCIRSLNDPRLLKLLKGFYENDFDICTLMINRKYCLNQEKEMVFVIDYGWKDRCYKGFAAMLQYTLLGIRFSEFIKCKPYVLWGKDTFYYDQEMEQTSKNVFTYYFQQVSDVKKIEKDTPCMLGSENPVGKVWKQSGYRVDESDIQFYADIYKRYIHMNDQTNNYIQKQWQEILGNKKVLGVHVRGTDFGQGFRAHPKMISAEEFKQSVIKMMQTGEYDKIFLATDDSTALAVFKEEFGEKLVYYTDVFRTSGEKGAHCTPNNRSLHRYKLGLEVLRDIYTLANCKGFLCGMSQVSFAVRYISRAIDRSFDEFVLIDHGIHKYGR